jgi:SAM-dependent methyltransferase
LEASLTSARRAAAAVIPRGGRVICGDERCLAAQASFDLICAFEVLEHIENDVAALSAWSAHLADDGLMLLSVPGFRSRFSAGDVRVGHFRRYDPEDLALAAESVGLNVLAIWAYGFPFGLALEAVRGYLARSARESKPMALRTEGSGRLYQPSAAWGSLVSAGMIPWRALQRPFHSCRLGHGLVMLASRGAARLPTFGQGRLPRSIGLRHSNAVSDVAEPNSASS